MALAVLLFHAPPLIVAKGRFQARLLCIDAHLVHDKREFAEIDRTDCLQIRNAPKPPVLILLLRQHTYVHQHIYRSRIALVLALVVHGGVNLADQLPIVHTLPPVRYKALMDP